MRPGMSLERILSGINKYDQDVTMADVADVLEAGYDEEYSIPIIKHYLLTKNQEIQLRNRNISVEDCLNGRTTKEHEEYVQGLYKNWNDRLGRHHFGSKPAAPQPASDLSSLLKEFDTHAKGLLRTLAQLHNLYTRGYEIRISDGRTPAIELWRPNTSNISQVVRELKVTQMSDPP